MTWNDALARLDYLRDLRAEGYAPPDTETFENARRVIDVLAQYDLPMPHINADASGDVVFEWVGAGVDVTLWLGVGEYPSVSASCDELGVDLDSTADQELELTRLILGLLKARLENSHQRNIP